MNEQIYYAENNQRRGPFTLEQIRSFNLQPNTLIWYKGLTEWTPICQAPLTSSFYMPVAPQPQQQPQAPVNGYQQQPQAPGYQQPPQAPVNGYQQQPQAPGYGYQQQSPLQAPEKPDTYMVWAILTTLFCCLPLGVVSIVYASKVDTLYFAGRYDEAEDASRNAANWALWSAIVGVIVILIYVAL